MIKASSYVPLIQAGLEISSVSNVRLESNLRSFRGIGCANQEEGQHQMAFRSPRPERRDAVWQLEEEERANQLNASAFGKHSLFSAHSDGSKWESRTSEEYSAPPQREQNTPPPLYPTLRPNVQISESQPIEPDNEPVSIHYDNAEEDPLLPDFVKRAVEGVDERYYDDEDPPTADEYKSTCCQVIARWHVLLIFSYLSFLQCLVWFTFSSVPDAVKSYYPSMTDSEIDLLLNWGPIIFIPALFVVAWMQNLSYGLRLAFWIGKKTAVSVFNQSSICRCGTHNQCLSHSNDSLLDRR